ncbi:GRB2-associated-binding protein 1 isoform X2 [Salmo trutta]|uniref:GRB2-associated-binding protein 1 isoform X2 n=1 Tax=Salmo trutta TaxID=8032 RepID=UPI001130488F|nr:GRB2-associated-binding protein 1-like isoform X2 [Salmo trutta]
MSGGADVVCAGWLRKSPPEKKLRRYAWKRRWFVLRSGRLTGDPDVLEYYKHDHARKPIRIINMSLCEQVDAGLTFNKKDLDSSYVFDVRTVERVFYLVADSEEDMNTWVRCICDLCGFNPTDHDRPTVTAQTPTVTVTTGHAPVSAAAPPPYQPVGVRRLESVSSQEEGTEYLWLSHCQSKTPHRPPVSSYHSTSSDTTDYNDNNLPSHWPPPSSSSSSSSPSSLAKGLPPHAHAGIGPWAVTTETNPFSKSQDSVLTPEVRRGWTRGHPSPHPRKHSLQLQAVSLPPICNDMVFNTSSTINNNAHSLNSNSNTTYQVPSSTPTAGSPTPGQGDSSTPPPRPPKPLVSAPAEVSSLATLSASLHRSASEPERSYGGGRGRGGEGQGGRGGRGNNPRAPRCNTIATSGYTHTGTGSQESYAVPRSLADQTRASMSDQTRASMSDQTRASMFDQTRASMSDQTRASRSDQTRASMSDQTRASMSDQTRASMSDQTRASMFDQTRASMSDQTRASMSDQTRASMSDQTRASMSDQTRASMSDQTRASMFDQTRASMSDQTRASMSDQTRASMSDQTRASMSDQTRVSMSDQTRASMFEFSDNFNSYFMNKDMVPLGRTCPGKEDVDENYVPMNTTDTSLVSLPPPSFPDLTSLVSLPPPSFPDLNSLVSLPPPSFPDPNSQDPNYVIMTPCPGELPSLGRQVPPPAHLGFRSSSHNPHTRPSRRHTTGGGGGGGGGGAGDTQPPPIHRNLKPRKGFSPISLHPKPLGLERTDSQTVEEFTRARRRKGMYQPHYRAI